MNDIRPEFVPHLLEWLRECIAQGGQVAVEPTLDTARGIGPEGWRVVVHNGQGGHNAAGTTLGVSPSQMDAELLAAGLWALL